MVDRIDRTGQQAGEYRLARQLGSGPYGTTYQAEHEQKDWDVYQSEAASPIAPPVAIKVFQRELAAEIHTDFAGEVQALSLEHPRIVPIHASGLMNATPYIVMDLFAEGSLRQRHPPGARVELTRVISYVQQAAEGLQFGHERGIVHRDLKPQNLLIRQNDEIMISDFGIGSVLLAVGPLTRFELAESVPYAAPELLLGQPQAASDQYALAVIVYEWLCGVRPFTGSQESIIAQQQSLPPTPLRVYEPTIPPAIEAVVLRALAKDPRMRYPGIRDFALALNQAMQPPGAYPAGQQGQATQSHSVQGYGPYGSYSEARARQAATAYVPGVSQAAMMYAPGSGQVATMYTAGVTARRSLSPATLAALGAIALMVGAVLAALGLILLRFPQPAIDAGTPINIVGMFLIAAGLLALTLRLERKARALPSAALIVFLIPLIGYTAVHLYVSTYIDQMSQFVLSSQEEQDILTLFLTITTILTQLSSAGLIILGLSLLKTRDPLPRWTRPVGWGLIVACAGFILVLLPALLSWTGNNQALGTTLDNLLLVCFFLTHALLASLGYALLTTTSAAPVTAAPSVQP